MEVGEGPGVENKDKKKINNIVNGHDTRKEAFGIDPKKISPILRRWTEQSDGDMIFNKDKIQSKYFT
jgi:hypothetical protein